MARTVVTPQQSGLRRCNLKATAMNNYDKFSRGSDRHKAIVNPDSLHLSPIDNTRAATKRFQSVADEVFALEGDGYDVVIVSSNEQYPFNLCVAMLLKRQAAEY